MPLATTTSSITFISGKPRRLTHLQHMATGLQSKQDDEDQQKLHDNDNDNKSKHNHRLRTVSNITGELKVVLGVLSLSLRSGVVHKH